MPSKHSKKSWKKRNDTDDAVEEGLKKVTYDKLHGRDFEQVPSADLFYEDKAGLAPVTAPVTAAAEGRQRKRQKLLKSEAILAAGRAVKPVGTQLSQPSKAAQGAKQKAKGRQQQQPRKQQAQAGTEAATLDIWGAQTQQSSAAAKRAGSRSSKKLAAFDRPAVEVDQPGCSYNPDAVQHQDAVASAVAAEVQKQLAAELAPKPLEMVGTGEATQDDLRMLQVDQAADEGPEEAEAAGAAGIDRRMPGTKTRTQRNKEQRRRQAEAELKARKQQKEMATSISQLKQLASQLDVEEEQRAANVLRKQIRKLEKQAEGPPRLGKTPFAHEPVHVLLSEELNGSLRSLKATSMLARDRFKSLQKRGLLEPRTRVRKHVGKRIASEMYANRQADRDLMA